MPLKRCVSIWTIQYQKATLKNTVGRFNKDLETIGKKLKDTTYFIPYELETSKDFDTQLKNVTLSGEKKMDIALSASNFILSGTNKMLETIAKRRNVTIKTYSNPTTSSSGIWWLDMLKSGLEIAAAYSEKKEQERTAVQEYESQVNVISKQIDVQINFYNQISSRINEIKNVTDEMAKRCTSSLELLEKILPLFDAYDDNHMSVYQQTKIIVKGISELAKVEILDANNKLSAADQNYILKSKQILTSSL